MSEIVCDTKTILVQYRCCNCEDGLMQYLNEWSGDYFLHKCQNCGYIVGLKTVYPLTRIVPIEPLRYPREDEMI